MRRIDACGDPSAAPAAHSGGGGTPGGPWAPLIGLGVLLVLAIPLSPMLWRARVRAARLGGHARTEEGAAAHTLAAWQELTDSAWDVGILPDESQTPRKAAARIVRLGHLDPAAGAAVHRVAEALEQVLYAPRPRPVAGLAEDVRRVIAALNGTVGRRTRLRALLAPRSAVRVLWAASARWANLKARATAARPTLRRPSGQRG
jgi:hypothetical protein